MSVVKGVAASLLLAAGLAMGVAGATHAQSARPLIPVSDLEEPYAGLPPDLPPDLPPTRRRPPVVIDESYYDAAPMISPTEIYRVLRENGFTPLGIPRQRGPVYTISAINLASGDDGRVVIDARTGRVIRFVPAWRLGDLQDRTPVAYNATRALPPMRADIVRAKPLPAALPRIARTNLPAETVPRAEAKLPQRTAAAPAVVAPPSAPTQAAAAPAPAIVPRPAPVVQATQDMPAPQGLE